MRDRRPADPNFQLTSGLASTVINLWAARDSAAEQALAWVAATMHRLTKRARERWRGEAYRIAETVAYAARKAGASYHHSVNHTMPIDLPAFVVEHPPTYLSEFIGLAVVQSALVLSSYTPAIICDMDREKRALERRKEDLLRNA